MTKAHLKQQLFKKQLSFCISTTAVTV